MYALAFVIFSLLASQVFTASLVEREFDHDPENDSNQTINKTHHRSKRSIDLSRIELRDKLYIKQALGSLVFANIIHKYQDPEYRLYSPAPFPIINYTKPHDFKPNNDYCVPDSFCPDQRHYTVRENMIPELKPYKMCACSECFHADGPCGRKKIARQKAGCMEEFNYELALRLTDLTDIYNIDKWEFVLEQVPIACKCSMMNVYKRVSVN